MALLLRGRVGGGAVSRRYYVVTVAKRVGLRVGQEWTILVLARGMAHAEEQVKGMGLILLYIVEDMG